ncbi:antibiotic biosynthesis monooxygenase [Actinocatenispora rupis]|uniref:ABM domain-containing protein n=1 Tax=Actinocatenispora rupis TaxID=519421 RepID=A0A8J3J8A9_9ACTN|nr:antibiotic biosynthesis monooxygenase [Actinocatenispora rupis]GID13531.1 hypothetical protein Aru02nite_44200 [Actinocatenispora rupis]
MLVVNRFAVDAAAADGFADRAREALAAFAACTGFTDGQLGRAADDPTRWCLVTRWQSVGAYRRALGSYQVKVAATPLLAESVEEPSAYEVLASAADGVVTVGTSDRSPTYDTPDDTR